MKRLLFTIGFGILFFTIEAQTISPELISSSGDSFYNTSYQLDWSIGELQTETYTASGQLLTQGFHQNSYVITAITDLRADLKMLVFPNPTSDLISLKVESEKFNEMQYRITDISGKVLEQGKVLSTLQTLNFTNYSVGTYLITISQNNQILKSFQIIKN